MVLIITAATLGFLHTFFGVDHWLPFIAIGLARRWKLAQIVALAGVCGISHVFLSVLIGSIGVAIGLTANSLVWFDSFRGDVAVASLIGFGLAYSTWAGLRLYRGVTHSHDNSYTNSNTKSLPDQGENLSINGVRLNIPKWMLFIVMTLGPCEPLIPLMLAPAVMQSWTLLGGIVTVFSVLTIGTMLVMVVLIYTGINVLNNKHFNYSAQYSDLLAGITVVGCGCLVFILGI